MKKKPAIQNKFILFFGIIVLLTPGVGTAAEVTINYIMFVNRMHYYTKAYKDNFKEIENKSNGRIKFRYRGGPDAVKIFEQAMAVKRGAADMVLTTPSFTGKIVKGPTMLTLNKVPVSMHRDNGLYDYLNTVYHPVGLHFIQMAAEPPNRVFRMMTKKKITETSQMKGLTLRGGDWMDAVAPAFGMRTISIRFNEDYTALERGLIDISRMTLVSMAGFKINEVANYLVETEWASAPASWIMNLKKWNKIPADLQTLILDTMYAQADDTQKVFEAKIKSAEEMMVKNGIEIVKLKDADYFLKVAEEKMYDYFLKEDPEVASKIYELTQK